VSGGLEAVPGTFNANKNGQSHIQKNSHNLLASPNNMSHGWLFGGIFQRVARAKTLSRRNVFFWLWLIEFFRNKRREYNNFGVQLGQKFLILAEKKNIEVLLVVH